MNPIRTEYEEIVSEALSQGTTIYDCDDSQEAKGNYQCQQFRDRIDRFINAYPKHKDDLLFDCWFYTHALTAKIVEQTQEIVIHRKPFTVHELYKNSFMKYIKVFKVSAMPENVFYLRLGCELQDKIVNSWKDFHSALNPVSKSEFETKHGFNPELMAQFITGEANILLNQLWQYHFTGMIDRVNNPGCQLDSMLILISPQKGLGKSTFLRMLAQGDKSTSADLNYLQLQTFNSDDKTCLEKLRGKAIVNLDECDRAFRGLKSAQTKAFITQTTDSYRPPYGRDSITYSRTCTLFATSNNPKLIQDLDGDRRFYPITCTKPLELAWFKDNYSDFMGYYKWCYTQGFKTYPTQEEQHELTDKVQAKNKSVPIWFETLEEVFEKLGVDYNQQFMVSVNDLLNVFQQEIGNKAEYHTEQLEVFLKQRGFEYGRKVLSTGKQSPRAHWYTGDKPTKLTRKDIVIAYQCVINGSNFRV